MKSPRSVKRQKPLTKQKWAGNDTLPAHLFAKKEVEKLQKHEKQKKEKYFSKRA